jgi:hypothetical protein
VGYVTTLGYRLRLWWAEFWIAIVMVGVLP